MRLAQQTAFKKKKKVSVVWRNYKTIVHPTGHEFTTTELRGYLLLALREILKIHDLENFPPNEEKVFQSLSQKSQPSVSLRLASPPPIIITNIKKKRNKANETDVEVIMFYLKIS